MNITFTNHVNMQHFAVRKRYLQYFCKSLFNIFHFNYVLAIMQVLFCMIYPIILHISCTESFFMLFDTDHAHQIPCVCSNGYTGSKMIIEMYPLVIIRFGEVIIRNFNAVLKVQRTKFIIMR